LSFFYSNCRLLIEFIFQQDGAPAHSAQRTELFRFHHKEPVAIKFAEYKPNGLSRVECNVGGLLQAWNKAENNYLGQPATRTDRQSCERLIKLNDWRLVLKLGAGGGHFEHSQWQWNSLIWSLVNCVVSMMLMSWCCSLNIIECWKISSRSG